MRAKASVPAKRFRVDGMDEYLAILAVIGFVAVAAPVSSDQHPAWNEESGGDV
jgi:hypothetical protein